MKLLPFFAAVVCTAVACAADVPNNVPLLFCKRLNYQGLHIYDTFYQWRHNGKSGGGIYVWEKDGTQRPVIDATTPNTLGSGIYFNPSLSYDARKILFSYKGQPQGNSIICEIGIDGTGLRQITNLDKNGNPYKGSGGGHHDVRPCYLPDGRIVFTSTRYSGLVPCANNGVAILHICNADGSDIHTISVNNVTEFDPAVLPDGRILFGRWEYIDKNALTIQSLWTVQPDGTNETALFANNRVFPEAILQAKPVPGSNHLVVGTFAPHNAPPRGSIAMIDTRMGKNDPKAIFNFEHHGEPVFDRGDSCDPWALDENTVIYSGVPDDAPVITARNRRLNGLLVIDRSGKKTTLLTDPEFDLHNPIPVVPRELPKVNADTTDRTKITGNFFVQNVYANLPNVKKGDVKFLRVLEETSRVSESPGGTWMNQTFSISAALAWSPKIFHGIVPVEPDGSVFFEAPAGRALYFQLLDKDYRLVRSMRTFIQAAPGTTRSCVGCHEYSNAPRISNEQGVSPPVLRQLKDESWGGGYMDYPSMIQPILDKKCILCHGVDKLEGGLDLTGAPTEYFNISYETLTARREKQYIADLIAGICCMNGTADWSCKIFEPYEHGSGKAPLADIILKEPVRSLLTDTERETLLAWIDTNGIYFGTWDYSSGPQLSAYAETKKQLIDIMKQSRCAECHTDEKGNIARFDNWFNLDKPELSLILRAPLNPSAQPSALALCRNKKVDSHFSTRGTMFKAGYAHQVLPLNKFPSQRWIPWKERQADEPVYTFADTKDTVYQQMSAVIQAGREKALANPRVDMPEAAYAGRDIVAGRSRQIIPQPLPENLPKITVQLVNQTGLVPLIKLSWERSARTIGLIAEIHRGIEPNFKPAPKTKIGQTERFEFYDKLVENEAPQLPACYAVVFISDPAATCGTCKSGAILDYKHTPEAAEFVPALKRIEDRCPLSMVEPMRSEPAYSQPVVIPKEVLEQMKAAEKAREEFLKTLKEPLKAKGQLAVPAKLDNNVLDLTQGGYYTVLSNGAYNAAHFRIEFDVQFNEPEAPTSGSGSMPVVLCSGVWNQSGWFLQKLGGKWRFHVSKVDCDGTESVPLGKKLHITATCKDKKLRLEQDGKVIAEKDAPAVFTPWSGNLTVGQYSTVQPPYQFTGIIGNIKIE
jgi:mono/diheme cytochrome c family protein